MDTNQFALRLRRLFDEKRKPDGKQYSQTDIVEGLGGVVTRVYIWKLRNGIATNPSFQVIRGLANFFAVDPGYFFENDAEAGPASSREWTPTREIAFKSSDLTADQQQMVLAIIETIKKTQKKDEGSP